MDKHHPFVVFECFVCSHLQILEIWCAFHSAGMKIQPCLNCLLHAHLHECWGCLMNSVRWVNRLTINCHQGLLLFYMSGKGRKIRLRSGYWDEKQKPPLTRLSDICWQQLSCLSYGWSFKHSDWFKKAHLIITWKFIYCVIKSGFLQRSPIS